MGNFIIFGYFVDFMVKKFGDMYYMYVIMDGSGVGFGFVQVWISKDFVNWMLMFMNWLDSYWIWVFDVMKYMDGNYYYFYCQFCMIYCGVSEILCGFWKNILGESEVVFVFDCFVMNVIILDGQIFVDDDGFVYLYWGIWGIYKGFGCGVGKLVFDMKSFIEMCLILNMEVMDFFEVFFVMKWNGIYYFMYFLGFCYDYIYWVQYVILDKFMGLYIYQGCIFEINVDGIIYGLGYYSILKEGNEYYMVYYCYDNLYFNCGFYCQFCVDCMEFVEDGSIKFFIFIYDGIGVLVFFVVKLKNLVLGVKVRVFFFYDVGFCFEYVVDDNNGILWCFCGMGQEWIEVDLGVVW